MSVYTKISTLELQAVLQLYAIGTLARYNGIEAGVTNTIYQITTSENQFILTIFEELTIEQLPFYIDLTDFLANQGMPCAEAIRSKKGSRIFTLKEKPAVLLAYLPGEPIMTPSKQQCYLVGKALGSIHRLCQFFPQKQDNPRGKKWFETISKKLHPVLTKEDNEFLQEELSFYRNHSLSTLPKGIMHADLFRDNVLFDNDELTGLLDFYYACYGCLLIDIASTVNDWCMQDDFTLHPEYTDTFLNAYQEERPLLDTEKDAWLIALRLAAFRFWLSRIHDYHFIQPGDMIQIKDPNVFKQILLYYRKQCC